MCTHFPTNYKEFGQSGRCGRIIGQSSQVATREYYNKLENYRLPHVPQLRPTGAGVGRAGAVMALTGVERGASRARGL